MGGGTSKFEQIWDRKENAHYGAKKAYMIVRSGRNDARCLNVWMASLHLMLLDVKLSGVMISNGLQGRRLKEDATRVSSCSPTGALT